MDTHIHIIHNISPRKESMSKNVIDKTKGGGAGLTALVNSILSGLPATGKP